jgi:hypothetical protein
MSIMSMRVVVVAMVVGGFAAPLAAQHGAHGGRDGAGIGRAPVYRGAPASAVGHPGNVGAVQYRIGQSSGSILITRPGPAAPDHRMGFGARDASRRWPLPGERLSQRTMSRAYVGLGLPYNVGWVGLGYPGSLDPAFYDNSTMTAPSPAPSYSDRSDALPLQQEAEAAPQPAPVSTYRPEYQRPLPPAAEPEPEDAVTLVFKDGRPREQIYNYMLTRTMLFVQEKRLREIAVADLDLDATAKVNHEAGVDFRLPDSRK